VISHTYTYDYDKENGIFQPKVSIITKKGLTQDITAEKSIFVKKQLVQIDLSSPSHPTQIAKVGDNVRFIAEFNGLPTTMKWDFGDKSLSTQCKGRTCTEVSKIYAAPGTYTLTLSLEFEDTQTIEKTMEIKIN
jgi:PKD repeat protein